MNIDRRQFIAFAPMLCGLRAQSRAEDSAGAVSPVPEPHFPSRLYLFIWRNWELANVDRIAHVLQTTASRVLDLGQSMGLPRKRTLTADQLNRLYVTLVRQNWHVLPESQITELLGWDRQKFEFTLKEDDFLALKLGPKPRCSPLTYAPPTAAERQRAAALARTLRESLGASLDEPGEPSLYFVAQLSDDRDLPMRDAEAAPIAGEIDLSSGWRLALSEESSIAHAVKRFGDYLENSMGVRLDESGTRTIKIRLVPRDANGEIFRIGVRASELDIAGYGETGVFEALSWMRDCMEERGGPFLQTVEISAKRSGIRVTCIHISHSMATRSCTRISIHFRMAILKNSPAVG